MTEPAPPGTPVPFPAAAAALEAINQSVKEAQQSSAQGPANPAPPAAAPGPHPALAALLMLREVREQLAGWESGLIETARGEGASWAELAGPLGVASRQAAERRYLRLRPGPAGSTGEERVRATRDTRAADRTVTAWARDNAADLRRLAARITTLTGLPTDTVNALNQALGQDDAARLVHPLTEAKVHLGPEDTELASHLDALTRHIRQLRRTAHGRRTPNL
ncbi:HSP18 transcriptional regulator [Streptomyces virginiae]|uniref:HSP18 transcriptional regulator n=1 Tax=Streptomyces virginiae TaxID=1961 RepID=UPI002DB9093D|nr:HSP18 transcriptional regulator [Streptomyces sp. CMAA1738]MEC4573856.1 HSP18 transcriptional regulator [Streptomyces sp. CMAA1738]